MIIGCKQHKWSAYDISMGKINHMSCWAYDSHLLIRQERYLRYQNPLAEQSSFLLKLPIHRYSFYFLILIWSLFSFKPALYQNHDETVTFFMKYNANISDPKSRNLNTILLTCMALCTFATNSILCRFALGQSLIDAQAFLRSESLQVPPF